MAGLDPATQWPRVCAAERFSELRSFIDDAVAFPARTDVRALGGRVKPGHDEFLFEETPMEKIFGGPIVATLFKLAVLSFIVGLVFAIFGIDPVDLWREFGTTIERAWTLVFDAINWGWKYAVLGAIVVLPLWIIYRLVMAVGGGVGPKSTRE